MAATRLRFTGNGATTVYIDLAKALSIFNRSLHRQKMIYTVYGGYFVDTAGQNNSRVNFNVAPHTWVTKAAINRGFKMWRRMISETLAKTDGMTTGKWNDFKIYLNNTMGPAPLVPVDAAFPTGNNWYTINPEWDYSTLTTADPNTSPDTTSSNPAGSNLELGPPDAFELQIVGDHVGSSGSWSRVSLLKSWLDSRPTVVSGSGDPVHSLGTDTDPLNNLFDVGDVDDDRLNVINAEGDIPPYDRENPPGLTVASGVNNNLQRVCTTFTTADNPLGTVLGFQAICGLVEVDVVSADNTWELVLDVEAKGVRF